jgi:hypothetical protein
LLPDSRGQYRSQFEQSLAVIRVGWNFKSFFLVTAAPGGAFPAERSGVTTASGTPNLITAFTSPVQCVRGRTAAQKAACRDTFGNPTYSLQQAVSDEIEEIAHVEEAHSDKAPKTSQNRP